VIFGCIALAAASNLLPSSVYASWPVLFILEATAVVAFGISWFVKGTTILPGNNSSRPRVSGSRPAALSSRGN
jgi:hypothetical protein